MISNLFSVSERQELLTEFVSESYELLDEVEPGLVELEKSSDQSGQVDPEIINLIFRLFHSLKGGAGFLGFSTIGRVTHTAETLLDFFRKQAATLNRDHIDILIITCDFLRQLLHNIESEHHDQGFEEDAEEIVSRLQLAIQDLISEPKGETVLKPAEKKALPPLTQVQETPPNPLSDSVIPQLTTSAELTQQFALEAEELLETAREALLKLEKEHDNKAYIAQASRAMHSLEGNTGFFEFSDLQRLSHQTETVLDLIRSKKLTGDSDLFSLLLEIVDALRSAVGKITQGEEPKIPSINGWINLLKDTVHEQGIAQVLPEPTKVTEMDASVERRSSFERRTGAERRYQSRRLEDAQAALRQTVRVDVEKLDSLLDMVGELVIAAALVSQNPDLKGLDVNLDRFEKSALHLDKITHNLQDIATSIRMIPLSGAFRRLIRLVRDLAQKAGKEVELKLRGEETEVDKTVIEQINDPLVHLIRNSIDHGVETPAEREIQGKAARAIITLEAKHVGGEVWILVSDDGRGLDREKIIAKAIERGLISGDGTELRDEELWQMILQPGFSTAEQVTDVSGRGVGLDIVRRNLENIGGNVEVRTEASRGTTLILRIPLTLAIIDGMIVRVGDTRYTIPLVAIKESLRPKEQDITRTMDGKEIVNLRGRLLPVLRLHELFNVNTEHHDLCAGILIVVENQGKSICLFVDEQLGQQQIVIKGLPEYISAAPCVSGCTILGDGEISLIIDIAGIIVKAESSKGAGANTQRLENRIVASLIRA